ncbi:PH domain-containing protein [Geobacter sp.]|uniref:PH domain-containing protein n=1 Tax=Geobacter sp. TaxID=46610 RepID=UPI00262133E5|nr:PH domain-containing protein [Geobacter sp.]
MGYVEQNLLQGEEVAYRARLHLIIFLVPALFALLGILAFAASAKLAVPILVIAVMLALDRYIRLVTSEFAVTTRRVIIKTGLVQRHTLELLLAKVETIGVEQGIPGRVFNYGTIVVTGTGGTKEEFAGIAKPFEFRKAVQERALFPQAATDARGDRA